MHSTLPARCALIALLVSVLPAPAQDAPPPAESRPSDAPQDEPSGDPDAARDRRQPPSQEPGSQEQPGQEPGSQEPTSQEPAQEPTSQEPTQGPPSQKIVWPRDRDRVVCVVDGERHTVLDLLTYLDERHAPHTLELMDTASGRALLTSPAFAHAVRIYADIRALEAEAEARGIDRAVIEDAVSDSLRRAFEKHLEEYVASRELRGNPVELTQDRVNLLLEHFQSRNGLDTERQGWLDALVPATPLEADGVLREYYREHPRYFGGRVTLSHILVRHRDARTGERLIGEDAEDAVLRVAKIQARLLESDEAFEDVAREMSDDRATAQRGGVFEQVQRFDPRLPVALCRTAWKLRDGEFTTVPVESPYGLHFVKRLGYTNRFYVFYHEDLKPEIAAVKRKEEQEDLVRDVRERFGVKLLY